MPTIVHSSRREDGSVLLAVKNKFGYVVQREVGTVRHIVQCDLSLAEARACLGINTAPKDKVLSKWERELEAAREKAARHARGGK